jgi:EAL domain-containing protein (putative c-di-GMP-specific phosphodiesterase class I)
VLQEACRRAAAWHREGAPDLVLSVNVSPRQFAEADFPKRLRSVLAATGFPAHGLQLEVTEGLLLEPTPETLQRIDELAALGVRLAVDDFGMGYSSLAYLKRFALHGLKIDRLFVKDIAERAQDLAIVRAIVDLGHGLGLHVTAEGVETEAQCEALTAVGCDALQGFLFARPAVADELMLADAAGALPTGAAVAAEEPATAAG